MPRSAYPIALDAAPQDGSYLNSPAAVKTVLQFLMSKLPPDQLAELDAHLTEGTTPQAQDGRMPEGKLKAELLNYTPKNRTVIRQGMDDVRGVSALKMTPAEREAIHTKLFPNAGRLKI